MQIMEARGNGPSYPAQGTNFVRATLSYGPLPSLLERIYGWQSQKRTAYDTGFHTYTLEWTGSFIKAYVDSRLRATLDLKITGGGGKSFWDRGNFPPTAFNITQEVVVENPYSGASPAAPFDQSALYIPEGQV